ncbi:MAG: NAD-dependent epimerase/dehydratase family protein [Opitutaceae bacterium]|jgi:nucleoside-diphosphate-sugar epimerase
MNLLIIGGSGFLSGTLTRIALDAGHRVTVITRGLRAAPSGATALVADRDDEAAFSAAVSAFSGDWDLVVDCIAFKAEHAAQTIRHFRHRAGRVVFISTDFVIASAGRTFPQDADTATCRTDDSYGGRKRRCEVAFESLLSEWSGWTILRPAHIYGPGSLLGCLPGHGRQPDLVRHILDNRPLHLVGAGHFLQQPVFAPDLARVILATPEAPASSGETYMVPGPEIIESRRYYEVIGALLDRPVRIEEIPVDTYRDTHPDKDPFLCHRIYDSAKLVRHGLPAPATPFIEGMRAHLHSLSALPSS